MSSNINPTNIDGNYPIAGQDNDSQGFRDNFTNIKTNLTFAKYEIEDLQGKVILKSPLNGTTLSNDMNNAILYRAQLKSTTEFFKDLGTHSAAVEISFLDANVQKLSTYGPLTITLMDVPVSGTYASMRLWINIQFAVNQTSANVTFPRSVTLNSTNAGLNANNIKTFTAAGNYLYELSTVDGGTNFWIIPLAHD